MSSSDDERTDTAGDDPLAGIDLDAWQPPPVRGGVADAVLRRMGEPVAVTAHDLGDRPRRRWSRWAAGGALVAAAGVAAGLVAISPWGGRSAPDDHDRGDVVAERASHLAIGPSSAELDAGAALSWRRERSRVSVAQLRGSATWRVGDDDTIVIDAGAMGASVEASGASLRVEVAMQLNGSDARVVAASVTTAAAVALVTVIVYQGHVKATSGGQTVNVAAGSAVEIKPGEPPREVLDVAAAAGEPRTVALPLAQFDGTVIEAVLRRDDITACLAGQSVQLTADGATHPDGTVQRIRVEPPGSVASCLEAAIRTVRFPPSRGGGSFHRKFTGDPTAPLPLTVPPFELDKLRIKGDKNIMPDDADKQAIEGATRLSGNTEGRVIASVKMCLDRAGKVSHVHMLKSSGYPGYDHKIQTEIMGWEYRPFEQDGKPASVCTAVTFVYSQR